MTGPAVERVRVKAKSESADCIAVTGTGVHAFDATAFLSIIYAPAVYCS
jgi:hypothetical protein